MKRNIHRRWRRQNNEIEKYTYKRENEDVRGDVGIVTVLRLKPSQPNEI